MSVPYAWQMRQWAQMQAQRQGGRVPHALLLSGVPGLGKRRFAQAFAQAALCVSPHSDGTPCGQCHPCRLFIAGTHPDFLVVEPEAPGKAIRVDAVRKLIEFLSLTQSFGPFKIVILDPADALNVNAANALLKTLEEPPGGVLLILVTSVPSRLPATARSRCQMLKFGLPSAQEARAWLSGQLDDAVLDVALAQAGGAPLAALSLVDPESQSHRRSWIAQLAQIGFDPAVLGAEMASVDYAKALDVCAAWFRDMARSASGAETREHPDQIKLLRALSDRVDLQGIFACLDQTNRLRGLQNNGLNVQLQLEELLLRYQASFKS